MLDEMLNGCLQKCWAPYGLQRWKGDYVGRARGGYLSFQNVWHSLTPMQRRHSMIIYDQKHLSVPLTSYQLADTFKSIPTQHEWKSLHEWSIWKNEMVHCVFDWVILSVITGNTLKRIMLKLLFLLQKWFAHISQKTRKVL